MKLCPKCNMQVDAEYDCPICGTSLTYEKETYEDTEKLLLNKYLVIHLLKKCRFPLLLLITLSILLINKPLEEKWIFLLGAFAFLIIWAFAVLYKRRISADLKSRYPILNDEVFVGRFKRAVCIIADIILTLILLVFLSMIVIPLYYIAFYLIPAVTYMALMIAAVIYIGYIIKLLAKRRRFLRELREFCKNAGCELEINGRPMLNALFCVRAGAEMIYSDRTVELYFISCMRRGVPAFLGNDGAVSFYHRIGFLGITLFDWFHEWQFCEKTADNSYILLMPAAKWVYTDSKKRAFGDHKGAHYTAFWGGRSLFVRYRPPSDVDNATKIGKSAVYTGGAFLRYMERTK